jgi:GTP cyclohydrolase I
MNAPHGKSLPDHAAELDTRALAIDRVGIRDLSWPIQVLDRAHRTQHTVARVAMYVGLPHHVRGTHMSRFVEILNARRGEITLRNLPDILAEVQRRLGAEDAHVELEFPYFMARKAPVSGVESLMEYRCAFKASRRGQALDFTLGVQVPVKSLCPCSKAISDRGAHNQRSTVSVELRADDFVWIEDVVERVESCASSPLYALLKREDEKYVTEQAYDRPRFAEDLVREAVLALSALPGVRWLRVSAENQESIHNHAAYAEIEWSRDAETPTPAPAPPAATPTLTFGEWLRALRTARRFSQQQMAELLDVSAPYLSRVESGEKHLSAEPLRRLADRLGLDLEHVQLRAGVVPPHLLARIAADPEAFLRWAGHQER